MQPIYKWTGGKRKEINIFKKYYPSNINTFVEPFCGAAAVFWDLEHTNSIINDIDFDLINFLNKIKEEDKNTIEYIKECSESIEKISMDEKNKLIDFKTAKELRGIIYYKWRNLDREDYKNLDLSLKAARFFIVNQLSFNGMRRFNSKGEFNIPYGNYKSLNFQNLISDKHIELLKSTQICNGDYKDIISQNDNNGTFIFLDPPYTRTFNEYSSGNVFGDESQIELANIVKNSKNSNILMIINKDEFTTKLYNGFILNSYKLKYSTNIKNRFSNDVEHLIISNKTN